MSTPTDPYNSSTPRPRRDDDQILDPLVENENDGLNFSADDQEYNVATPASPAPENGSADLAESLSGDLHAEVEPQTGEQEGQSTADNRAESGVDVDRAPHTGEIYDPAERILHEDKTGSDSPATITRTSMFAVDPDSAATTATGTQAAVATGAASDLATRTGKDGTAKSAPETATAGGFDAASQRRETWTSNPGTMTDIPDEPAGRGLSHTLSVFGVLLLVPVLWYLSSDAGARLFYMTDSAWQTGQTNLLALAELAGAIALIGVIWMLTKASSLGAQIWGAILGLVGIIAVAVPTFGKKIVKFVESGIGGYNDFTDNVVHHLNMDLGTGRIAILGAILFFTGLACHFARRDGRRTGIALGKRKVLIADQSAA